MPSVLTLPNVSATQQCRRGKLVRRRLWAQRYFENKSATENINAYLSKENDCSTDDESEDSDSDDDLVETDKNDDLEYITKTWFNKGVADNAGYSYKSKKDQFNKAVLKIKKHLMMTVRS